MTLPDKETMYEALVNRDTRFEGTFIVGVKTTGIFCRPTCNARKPKMENVEYFPSTSQALDSGYRPCKVCHPMQLQGEAPEWLRQLLSEVERTPDPVMKDADLRSRGIDPTRVRRWFTKHHGITFQAYLRSLRVNGAYGRIRQGSGVARSAFEAGYESLSGFNESFRKTTGFAPSRSASTEVVSLESMATPLGPMLAGATESGVCLLEFADRPSLANQVQRLERRLEAVSVTGPSPHFAEMRRQLGEYFDGARQRFELPLVMPGTEFQQSVWEVLSTIPYGSTRSYGEQAVAVGKPGAARAVARANGDNRISIVVPCHRVIAKSGDVSGYGGGQWRKRFLLDLEREHSAEDPRG